MGLRMLGINFIEGSLSFCRRLLFFELSRFVEFQLRLVRPCSRSSGLPYSHKSKRKPYCKENSSQKNPDTADS